MNDNDGIHIQLKWIIILNTVLYSIIVFTFSPCIPGLSRSDRNLILDLATRGGVAPDRSRSLPVGMFLLPLPPYHKKKMSAGPGRAARWLTSLF